MAAKTILLDTVARGIIILPGAHISAVEKGERLFGCGRAARRYRDDEEVLLICRFGVDHYGLRWACLPG
jgi:hypothetical protein